MSPLALVALTLLAADAPLRGDAPDGGFVLGQSKLGAAAIGEGEAAPGDGCWLSTETCLAQATRIKTCEAQRAELLAQPAMAPTLSWAPLFIGLAVGLAAGAAVTWAVLKQ